MEDFCSRQWHAAGMAFILVWDAKKPGCADISRLGVKKLVGTKGKRYAAFLRKKAPEQKKYVMTVMCNC